MPQINEQYTTSTPAATTQPPPTTMQPPRRTPPRWRRPNLNPRQASPTRPPMVGTGSGSIGGQAVGAVNPTPPPSRLGFTIPAFKVSIPKHIPLGDGGGITTPGYSVGSGGVNVGVNVPAWVTQAGQNVTQAATTAAQAASPIPWQLSAIQALSQTPQAPAIGAALNTASNLLSPAGIPSLIGQAMGSPQVRNELATNPMRATINVPQSFGVGPFKFYPPVSWRGEHGINLNPIPSILDRFNDRTGQRVNTSYRRPPMRAGGHGPARAGERGSAPTTSTTGSYAGGYTSGGYNYGPGSSSTGKKGSPSWLENLYNWNWKG